MAVERSLRTPVTSEVADTADVVDDEAGLDEIGIDQEVLDSLEELEESQPVPAIDEPLDPSETIPDVSEPAVEEPEEPEELEPTEEEPERVEDGRLQIDDVVWTVPDDNDRWDLDRDGNADTIAPNPWQIIDALLPAGEELGDAWDYGYRSTSIVAGGSIIAPADTDCDDYDVLTGLNSEYHGIQTWEGEGEEIRAFVIALDDSIQAAGLAAMLGELSTRCPIIGPDPLQTPFEPFHARPLLTAHDGLDSVLLEYTNGTTAHLVARSHGALLHIASLVHWTETVPSARAATDFAIIVDRIVATTPGASPADDPGSGHLASALPTGNDLGLVWGDPLLRGPTYTTDASRSSCAARAAFGAVEDHLQVTTMAWQFEPDIYSIVTLGEFDSASEADDTMIGMAQLSACPPSEGFDMSVMDHDVDIDVSGRALVPFTYDDHWLDGTVMVGVVLTVGPYVATIVVGAPRFFVDSDAGLIDPSTIQRQLQMLVDHMVDGLEALS